MEHLLTRGRCSRLWMLKVSRTKMPAAVPCCHRWQNRWSPPGPASRKHFIFAYSADNGRSKICFGTSGVTAQYAFIPHLNKKPRVLQS